MGEVYTSDEIGDRNIHYSRAFDIDYILFSVLLIFYGFGIVMVFSASINEGMKFNDDFYFLKRQILWTVLSIITCMFFMFVDYRIFEKYRKIMIWGVILILFALLMSPLMHLGIVHRSRRWFRIAGVGFQPSEFAKFAVIFYLASVLAKKEIKLRMSTGDSYLLLSLYQ